MRLSDIMGAMGLSVWTIAAMALFLLVYVTQVLWTFAPRNRDTMERGAALPLDDGELRPPADRSCP